MIWWWDSGHFFPSRNGDMNSSAGSSRHDIRSATWITGCQTIKLYIMLSKHLTQGTGLKNPRRRDPLSLLPRPSIAILGWAEDRLHHSLHVTFFFFLSKEAKVVQIIVQSFWKFLRRQSLPWGYHRNTTRHATLASWDCRSLLFLSQSFSLNIRPSRSGTWK